MESITTFYSLDLFYVQVWTRITFPQFYETIADTLFTIIHGYPAPWALLGPPHTDTDRQLWHISRFRQIPLALLQPIHISTAPLPHINIAVGVEVYMRIRPLRFDVDAVPTAFLTPPRKFHEELGIRE